MKKWFLISALILLTGCAAVSKWTSAQADCATDPACLAEAQRYAKVGEAVASPWGPIAVGASGSCILFIALGILDQIAQHEHFVSGRSHFGVKSRCIAIDIRLGLISVIRVDRMAHFVAEG